MIKNSILSLLVIAFVVLSCNKKKNEINSETTIERTDKLYACTMHPEITGKKVNSCSVCGMELTELVTK